MRQFGLINSVRLRREDLNSGKGKGKGKFKVSSVYTRHSHRTPAHIADVKGSVFVEFASVEECEKFVNRESIPKFAEDGPEMEFTTKYVHF